MLNGLGRTEFGIGFGGEAELELFSAPLSSSLFDVPLFELELVLFVSL